jgi:hypothetical protein
VEGVCRGQLGTWKRRRRSGWRVARGVRGAAQAALHGGGPGLAACARGPAALDRTRTWCTTGEREGLTGGPSLNNLFIYYSKILKSI